MSLFNPFESSEQRTMSLIQFAELLSKYEVFNLVTRRYHDGWVDVLPSMLSDVVSQPKMTQVYKTLTQLKDINGEFEYLIGIADISDEDVWRTLSFTKSHNAVTVDFH